ncbi:hypothetical protein Bca52824_037047 [Brassica carinata]|uniref:Uncharacterized protein n=1 Tax=Brassica carinata TaxID=52824 RepID=A0A8X7S620_BRACI|nr:hypothetical protein Bca52824_037047 [Brassica carinata]
MVYSLPDIRLLEPKASSKVLVLVFTRLPLELISLAHGTRDITVFHSETTAIFPVSRFRDFFLDVKKLRDLKPERFCGIDIYNGILIRFIKGSKAYLGQTEDSVVIDFNYYRADDALTPS